MKASSQNYKTLHDYFVQLLSYLKQGIVHKDNRVEGIGVDGGYIDKDFFDVTFLGQLWRFELAVVGKNNKVDSGIVMVTRRSFVPDAQQIGVCTFSLDTSGYTDIKDPGMDNDLVHVGSVGGALHIVLEGIRRGLC